MTFTKQHALNIFRDLRARFRGYLSLRLQVASDNTIAHAPKSEWQANLWEEEHDRSEVALLIDNQIVAVIKLLSSSGSGNARIGFKALDKVRIIRTNAIDMKDTPLFKTLLYEFHNKNNPTDINKAV